MTSLLAWELTALVFLILRGFWRLLELTFGLIDWWRSEQ